MAEDLSQGFADEFDWIPGVGMFLDSSEEKARRNAVQTAKDTAADYQSYRPQYQGAQQKRGAAIGGVMSPLNQLVQANTGQSIDLGSAMNRQMVSPEMMSIGAPRPDVKEENSNDGAMWGAGVGLLLGDPVLGGLIGWAGDELDWW